jgi:proline iminopeptidase
MPALRLAALVSLAACASAPAARPPEVAHPPGRLVSVLGQNLWVEIAGRGEPLLLVPGGGGGSHDYYHPWFDALAEDHQVIYYDGFGRGRSARATRPAEYSFERDVAEIDALLDALGLEAVNLYGHSYGGLVAEAYAIARPARVRRLILANTFVAGRDYQRSNDHVNAVVAQHFPEMWAELTRVRAAGLRSSSPEHQRLYFGALPQMIELFYLFDPDHARHIVFDEHSFNAEEYYAICGDDADFVVGPQLAGLDFGAGLARLEMPILVLAGRGDGVVLPALVAELRRHVPRATHVTFERSGHFPFLEETARHAQVLKDFLKSR